MNNKLFLKSTSVHDEALLATLVNMIETNPNAKVVEASFNLITVVGNGLDEFLQELVGQVASREISAWKAKKTAQVQTKGHVKVRDVDVHCIRFIFYNLDLERRGLPISS